MSENQISKAILAAEKVKHNLNKFVFKNKYEISIHYLNYLITKRSHNETIMGLRDRIIELQEENTLLTEQCKSLLSVCKDREFYVKTIRDLEKKLSVKKGMLAKLTKALSEKKRLIK